MGLCVHAHRRAVRPLRRNRETARRRVAVLLRGATAPTPRRGCLMRGRPTNPPTHQVPQPIAWPGSSDATSTTAPTSTHTTAPATSSSSTTRRQMRKLARKQAVDVNRVPGPVSTMSRDINGDRCSVWFQDIVGSCLAHRDTSASREVGHVEGTTRHHRGRARRTQQKLRLPAPTTSLATGTATGQTLWDRGCGGIRTTPQPTHHNPRAVGAGLEEKDCAAEHGDP